METLKQLRSDTQYFGVSFPDERSHHPLVIDLNGIRTAFFSVISELTVPLIEFDDFNYLELLDPVNLAEKIAGIRQ
jgi:hypothetical protein